MLELINIIKDYYVGSEAVHALKGVDIRFRKNEFVSILGPSGCGKTTLLNIIGGLDRYTKGDLKIKNKSTKTYRDSDWDVYRNHSIGFVFQSYNLISHLTVVENVELALTLSGVSKGERRRRAIAVLNEVGLSDKIKSRPNQLSGGQMQRVAIARALINDPEILLADEPTGALDTKTSEQIIGLIKEISKNRLVIMVTHNSEIAMTYSTRIIRLVDGLVTDDSDAPTAEEWEDELRIAEDKERQEVLARKSNGRSGGIVKKRTSMSFFTALSLSFKNLLTKKTRTILTSIAGSIGIIGIALILSMSNGFQVYINRVQEDTLSSYPITVQRETMDLTGLIQSFSGNDDKEIEHQLDMIYSNDILVEMLDSMLSQTYSNDLVKFKKHLDDNKTEYAQYLNAVKYGYNLDLNIFSSDLSSITQINPSTLFEDLMGDAPGAGGGMSFGLTSTSIEAWSEMIDNDKLLKSQYDLVKGRWPVDYDEVVLTMDENNEISDFMLYALGLKDQAELKEIMQKLINKETVTITQSNFTYDDILNQTFKLALPTDYYIKENGSWVDKSKNTYGAFNSSFMKPLLEKALTIKIVGILRPNPNAAATSIQSTIGYTKELTNYYVNEINKAPIVIDQKNRPDIDIFTNIPFERALTADDIRALVNLMPDGPTKTMILQSLKTMSDEDIVKNIGSMFENDQNATYEKNMAKLGSVDLDNPSVIYIYPVDFNAKEFVTGMIEKYNTDAAAAGNEEAKIKYTDYIGLILSAVSTIINAISYILIGFVSISLVVSSIMIGIITYISVLERIKEIGILRSVGASKRDISRVFNAETLIVGFTSGVIGILMTLILLIPVNLIVGYLSDISGLAVLPWVGAVALIVISMLLTLVSGLIPSRLAAKKDPVEALRTE